MFEKEENCECGLMENGMWSEELFDKFGFTCDESKLEFETEE